MRLLRIVAFTIGACATVCACIDDNNSVNGDAGTEGGAQDGQSSDAADAPSTWCGTSTAAAFCADFDAVTSVGDSWTTVGGGGGGTVSLDLAEFTSAPHSAKTWVPAGPSAFAVTAGLTKLLPTTKTHAVFAFDLKVANIGVTDGASWMLQFGVLEQNGQGGVALYVDALGKWYLGVVASIDGSSPFTTYALANGPAYGRFVHVVIDVIFSTVAGSVMVSLDGTTEASATGIPTTSDATPQTISATIGILEAIGATPSALAAWDNVTLTLP